MSIKVIDAICGAGKTSYAIQHINEQATKVGFGDNAKYESDKKFIYVTPFLSEVKRIKEATLLEFFEPEASYKNGSKSNHVKSLIEEGCNIVMSHELFARLEDETLMDIEEMEYDLIMDEVANVLEIYNDKDISIKDDFRMLAQQGIIDIERDGCITWKDPLYSGRFNDIKLLSQKQNLFLHNGCILFWTMPVMNFLCFENVYILTYLFDGQIQRYYYDLYEVDYTKHSVRKNEDGKYELVKYDKSLEPRNKIGVFLDIYEDYQRGKSVSKLNTNYLAKKNKRERALSKSWFEKAEDEQMEQLKKNLVTFFKSQSKAKASELFWTTFKSQASSLKNERCKLNKKDDRSKDNFVAFNTRATNDYADRTAMAFVLNRFMNPNEKQFFSYRGIEVDEDLLAVSDLIQFLFRGCIRKGEPMSCYIPSERMRTLLYRWINFEI
ncbi:hypothetical protein [Bacillus cereus group sp. BcHK114]|uniref:hypothetical protein n=1 Tax=Bacillus cereus group sp. BcHK114 TaxID=3018095 RepID=UPI0022E8D05F|nr:hypothetical protein [Bacillus cereus group sp. BcHK114]MDA1958183.1 hypothetical protein [Bacillus cereus group sp. BcHK114]